MSSTAPDDRVLTLSTTEARRDFAELVNRVAYGQERINITRRGKPVAVLLSRECARLLEVLEDSWDLMEIGRTLADMKEKGETPVPWERVKAQLGL